MKLKKMQFDEVPWVILNTFGITMLIISRVISMRKLGTKFAAIQDNISLINNKLNTMATEKQLEEIVTRFEAATNYLASEVNSLKEQVKGQGLPEAVENDFVNKMSDLATRLESIGRSTEEPLPGAVGSTIPVPLGQGQITTTEPNADTQTEGNGSTAVEPVTSENSGENTPPAQGEVTANNDAANAIMNPNPEPIQAQPGDTQFNVTDGTGVAQVGAQPIANEGELNTNPNTDSNPNNDEQFLGVETPIVAEGEAKDIDTGNAVEKATGTKSAKAKK